MQARRQRLHGNHTAPETSHLPSFASSHTHTGLRKLVSRSAPGAAPGQPASSPARQQASAWQPLQHVDAVIVDGTNLFNISRAESKRYRLTGHATSDVFAAYLTFLAAYTQAVQTYVVFDNPNRRSTQSIRSAINPNYLAKRRARQHRTNDASEHTALEVEARRVGAVSLTAPQGYEVDDVIAGAVDAITGCCEPPPNIVIVSADADMQQLLSSSVAWLEPLPSPTRRVPCPFVLHTHEEFLAAHGFPATAYVQHQALVGKPDAGIKGAGVSARTAKKLLQRYGSIQGICAAASAGELRAASYPAELCAMFESSGSSEDGSTEVSPESKQGAERLARALSNLHLLQLRPEALPIQPQELLQPLLQRAQALQSLPAATATPSSVALKYPAHQLHQETCQTFIRRLLAAAASLQLPVTGPSLTASGSVADILVLPYPPQGVQEPTAIVVLGPADLKYMDSQLGVPLPEAYQQWATAIQRLHMLQIPKAHLVGSTWARLQNLRQEPGMQLRVAPFFEVPETEAECCQYLQWLLLGEAPTAS